MADDTNYLDRTVVAQQAYQDALSDLARQQRRLYEDYGFEGDIDEGGKTTFRIDPVKQHGRSQQLLRSHATAMQQLRENLSAKGLGNRGLAAQRARLLRFVQEGDIANLSNRFTDSANAIFRGRAGARRGRDEAMAGIGASRGASATAANTTSSTVSDTAVNNTGNGNGNGNGNGVATQDTTPWQTPAQSNVPLLVSAQPNQPAPIDEWAGAPHGVQPVDPGVSPYVGANSGAAAPLIAAIMAGAVPTWDPAKATGRFSRTNTFIE